MTLITNFFPLILEFLKKNNKKTGHKSINSRVIIILTEHELWELHVPIEEKIVKIVKMPITVHKCLPCNSGKVSTQVQIC